jgi:hypothetical protein
MTDSDRRAHFALIPAAEARARDLERWRAIKPAPVRKAQPKGKR